MVPTRALQGITIASKSYEFPVASPTSLKLCSNMTRHDETVRSSQGPRTNRRMVPRMDVATRWAPAADRIIATTTVYSERICRPWGYRRLALQLATLMCKQVNRHSVETQV